MNYENFLNNNYGRLLSILNNVRHKIFSIVSAEYAEIEDLKPCKAI